MAITIHPADDRRELRVVGERITPLLSAPGFELFEVTGDVDTGPPPHSHPWDEGYVLLEGALVVGSDAGERTLEPGERAVVPAGTLHWYRVTSPRTRFLTSTGGQYAGRFFRDVDANLPPGPPTDESMPALVEVARRHQLSSPLFEPGR